MHIHKAIIAALCVCAQMSVYAEPVPLSPANASADVAVSDRISLDVRGMEAADLFRLLSLKTGKTIVPSKGISGRITVFLHETSFDEALDIVTLSQGYATACEGKVWYVMSKDEYRAMYGKEFSERRVMKTFPYRYGDADNIVSVLQELRSEAGKVIVDKAGATVIVIDIPEKLATMERAMRLVDKPLSTKIYPISYAKPTEVRAQIEPFLTKGVGKAVADDRAGNLMVSDLPSAIAALDAVIAAVDAETPQVLVKAEIVQVTLSDSQQTGVNWSKWMSQSKYDGLKFESNFNVLPTSAADFGKVSAGVTGVNSYLSMIEFLKKEGNVKVLSRPQIAVLDKHDAYIHVGVQQPFVSSTKSTNQTSQSESYSDTVEFKDIGVMLKVTPSIGKDGFITMKLAPEVSTIKETITTSAGSIIPVLEKTTAETSVKAKDGSMIVIAGLIQDKKTDDENGIPFLKNIPLIGYAFKNKTKTSLRTETVIFLTPVISRGDETVINQEFSAAVPAGMMPDEYRTKVFKEELKDIADAPSAASPTKASIKGIRDEE